MLPLTLFSHALCGCLCASTDVWGNKQQREMLRQQYLFVHRIRPTKSPSHKELTAFHFPLFSLKPFFVKVTEWLKHGVTWQGFLFWVSLYWSTQTGRDGTALSYMNRGLVLYASCFTAINTFPSLFAWSYYVSSQQRGPTTLYTIVIRYRFLQSQCVLLLWKTDRVLACRVQADSNGCTKHTKNHYMAIELS